MMAAVIRGLDSGEWVMWLEKNCLQFFQVSLRKKFRGTIQRKVTSTSIVFRILIRVKSRKGRGNEKPGLPVADNKRVPEYF